METPRNLEKLINWIAALSVIGLAAVVLAIIIVIQKLIQWLT